MPYKCMDCSYHGKQFPQGICPACGSKNIEKAVSGGLITSKKRQPYTLILCIGLWIYLGIEIYRRMVG